jgi:hypothetical protein
MERKVMIAATRSNPECSASLKTPKLPVRITKKDFNDTSSSAEPTLSSAARFFSRDSPGKRVSMATLRLP